jgi:hypothetical protein
MQKLWKSAMMGWTGHDTSHFLYLSKQYVERRCCGVHVGKQKG